MSDSTELSFFAKIRPFLFAGVSTMAAAACVQPIDCLKVRIQIFGEEAGLRGEKPDRNPLRAARYLWRTEGIKAFYRGLGSGQLRQAVYGTSRLGVYKYLAERQQRINIAEGRPDSSISFSQKIIYSLISGFCGSVLGNPIDLSMVRFQSNMTLPIEYRRNYRHVFHAIYTIGKEEGVPVLWRGFTAFALRVMAATCAQIIAFEETKTFTNRLRGIEKDDFLSRVYGVLVGGVSVTAACLPFDNIKMKMQKMVTADGKALYSSVFDCMVKTIQREGILGPWIGFSSFYLYAAPHTMISFMIMDYLHHFFGDQDLK